MDRIRLLPENISNDFEQNMFQIAGRIIINAKSQVSYAQGFKFDLSGRHPGRQYAYYLYCKVTYLDVYKTERHTSFYALLRGAGFEEASHFNDWD